jgi:hypothetical protein
MEKALRLRLAQLAAYKKLFWPISILPMSLQHPLLLGCGMLLLIVGVACTNYEVMAALLELIEKYNGAFTALASIAIACFTLTLWRSTDKLWRTSERALTELEAPVISIKIINT